MHLFPSVFHFQLRFNTISDKKQLDHFRLIQAPDNARLDLLTCLRVRRWFEDYVRNQLFEEAAGIAYFLQVFILTSYPFLSATVDQLHNLQIPMKGLLEDLRVV